MEMKEIQGVPMDSNDKIPLINPTESDDGTGGHDSKESAKLTSKFRQKWKTISEVVLLSLLLFLLWGIYAAVPTVFYILKPVLQVHNFSADVAESELASPVLCASEFYLYNGSMCRPLCHVWVSGNVTEDVVKDVFTMIISVICLLSCAVLAVVAFTVQRNEILFTVDSQLYSCHCDAVTSVESALGLLLGSSYMLKFPKVYLVNASMTTAVAALFVLIGFIDRRWLFCHSIDLIDTFKHETPFCIISGIVYVYAVMQLNIWAMFHAMGLCWAIVFPFHYRSFRNEGKIKFILATSVIFALLFPTIPALLYLKDGYAALFTPTRVCTGRSLKVTYFAFLLPSSIILATTTFALAVVFWTILKQFLLKKVSKNTRERSSLVGKAEAKVLFVVCYYVLLGVFSLVTLTYFEATNPSNLAAVREYFKCQLSGYQPGEESHCGKRPNVRLLPFNILSAVGIVQLAFIPVVILVFTVRFSKPNFDRLNNLLRRTVK